MEERCHSDPLTADCLLLLCCFSVHGQVRLLIHLNVFCFDVCACVRVRACACDMMLCDIGDYCIYLVLVFLRMVLSLSLCEVRAHGCVCVCVYVCVCGKHNLKQES